MRLLRNDFALRRKVSKSFIGLSPLPLWDVFSLSALLWLWLHLVQILWRSVMLYVLLAARVFHVGQSSEISFGFNVYLFSNECPLMRRQKTARMCRLLPVTPQVRDMYVFAVQSAFLGSVRAARVFKRRLSDEVQKNIVSYARENPNAIYSVLCDKFGVSSNTLRKVMQGGRCVHGA